MHRDIVELLACPRCRGGLAVTSCMVQGEGELIQDGYLSCSSCAATFPIVQYIPRFVPLKNYAASFGFEWQKHGRTQIDKFNGTSISHDRFFRQTNWATDLRGQRVLEVGCGSGRFTEVVLGTGAEVFSIDYSSAVDVNLENNGLHPQLNILQADLYALPFRLESFDKIFCFGVIQHCPDPQKALLSLIPFLRPGGEIVVDIYGKSFETYFMPKYYIRPFIKNLSPRLLYSIVEKVVPILLPIKIWLRRHVPKCGRYVAGVIPVANFDGYYPLTKAQLLEWAILDTFDDLSPKYDKPQKIETFRSWFGQTNLVHIDVKYASPCIVVGKATMPNDQVVGAPGQATPS